MQRIIWSGVLSCSLLLVGGCGDDNATCTPECDGRECGPDGCGGSCDPGCDTAQVCTVAGTCYGSDCADGDGDDYGIGSGCLGPDCDDGAAAVHPGQAEVPYDGIDNDCDPGTPDDDLDGDGFLALVDCDDEDASSFPGAPEVCGDGVDQDCNGADLPCGCTPECDGRECGPDGCGGSCAPGCDTGQVCTVAGTCYGSDCADGDGDGYGIGSGCLGPDCDDGAAAVHPGQAEVPYDGIDNDCDPGTPDDDLDGDGFLALVDCDDEDPAIHPGATEVCGDGVDQDCVGGDEACPPYDAGLCDACVTADTCPVAGSACVTLDDGSFCLNPCGVGDICPAGYTCSDPGLGTTLCVPMTNACLCDGTDLSLQRSCEVTGPYGTCYGVQSCTVMGWTTCNLPGESCNAQDDNCDGQVDEGFVDSGGRYVTDEHCGYCGNDCTAMTFNGQAGVCDTSANPPQCGP